MSSIWTVRRSATDTKLAGVCGGVAEHWDIDPVLVRVAWALLALSGGIGVVLYVAAWLLVPVQGRPTATLDDLLGDRARRWPKEVWVALVALACLAVFAVFGSASPFGVGPAVVIACIWYFGFYKQREGATPPAPPAPVDRGRPAPDHGGIPTFVTHPGPATPFTVAAEGWRRRIEEHVRETRAAAATATATWPTPPAATSTVQDPAPDPEVVERTAFLATPDPVGLYSEPVAATALAAPVPRRLSLAARRLRLLTLLVLGLVLGGLNLADRSGVAVTPAAYAGAALLVVGLALVAATWFGRARGLLAVGLLLVPVVVLTSVAAQILPAEPFGHTQREYSRVADLPRTPEIFDSGQAEVDLSSLVLTEDASYTAQLGTGQLEVRVPDDVNVEVRYGVDLGAVEGLGQEIDSGFDLRGTEDLPAPVEGRPTLTLDLTVDAGQVAVIR
ncbi:Phage shock protein PspC (stress-responsive transcriptional regulator) [Friedmanniella luteola]|uniref:Phage shock protein PspC (Stress-responsive transcriptional regulator) n=1 Tax=Friedmanniella luteola TaxID=546871 RepID=A0A1H1YSY0_9ACTN|nr:PspC domain-containing protein [Friedmanniella luteola]SDT24442.1 Phage shock protein PspC (stress-responsive transcriptional regulator) [Friedmanniella luteola]